MANITTIPIKKIEHVFTFFALLIFTDPTSLYRFLLNQVGSGNTSRLRTLLVLIIGSISFALIVWRWRKTIKYILKAKWLWLLVGFALLSFLWSTNAKLTIRTSLNLILTTSTGVYFGTRFSCKEQVRLLAHSLLVSGILCVIFAVVIPQYGVMGNFIDMSRQQETHQGLWQGIYTHKNFLGRIMTLGGITCFLAALEGAFKQNWLLWCGFAITSAIVYISSSKTSLIALVLTLILIPFYQGLRWSARSVIPFGILSIVIFGSIVILLGTNAESVLNSFVDRDLTLTGRTELWIAILDQVQQQPWFGYGYKGFWTGWLGPANAIWLEFRWLPAHAHNGLLQLCLELGLMGLAIFLISFITLFKKSVSFVRLTRSKEELFPLAFLTFLFFFNLSESVLLDQNIYWLLYTSITMTLYKELFTLRVQSNLWHIDRSNIRFSQKRAVE